MHFRTAFSVIDYVDTTGIDFSDSPSLTEQHHAADLEINRIVNRALRTGAVEPSLMRTFGKYADATTAGDFLSANITYRKGVEAFEALPSDIRDRFHNDPVQLLTFIADEKNRDEAIKLGFIEAPAPESPAVGTLNPLDINVPTDTNGVGVTEKNEK